MRLSANRQSIYAPFGEPPIREPDRLPLLDVLRGFALFGVLLANLIPWFSGSALALITEPGGLSPQLPDRFVQLGMEFLINRKFVTLFAFLFGLGISEQVNRVGKAKTGIWHTTIQRLAVLFILGLLHTLLLWWGDILHGYALLGLVLVLFQGRKNQTILIWSFGLALVVPLGILYLGALIPSSTITYPTVINTAPRLETQVLSVFAKGTYRAVLHSNWTFYRYEMWSSFVLLFWVGTLGTMLLGFWAGRQRIFHHVHEQLPLFHRLLRAGLIIGIIGSSALVISRLYRGQIPVNSLPYVGLKSLALVGVPALTTAYVSAIVLLYQSTFWKKWLNKLVPVGRMSLTNYLMQTLVWSWLFYGYGLGRGWMGQIGPTVSLLLGLGLFAGQLLFSTWWLRHFRFGPMEWLWRSLTYRQFLPMRIRKPVLETVPETAL